MNPLLFPPALLKRAFDDLAAIAEAARLLTDLEEQVIDRIDRVQADAFQRLDALLDELGALRADLVPIQQLSAVRDAVEPLPGKLDAMRERLDGLREEMAPIQQLPAVREAVEPLSGKLDGTREQLDDLREDVKPIQQLTQVREGIEPLDDDMRSVRITIAELEPIIRQINTRLGTLDQRIETMRADLSLVGDLADKVPGVGR